MAPEDDCISDDADPNIGGDLYYEEPDRTPPTKTTDLPGAAVAPSDPQFNFSVGTKVKEPAVPQTSAEFLEHLKALQHFGQTDWNSVRYVEVRRQYVHAPGFTSPEPNAEISNYDNSKFTAHMKTAFSSLTFALLKQSKEIRNNVREFLNWAQHKEQVNYENIFERWNDIFTNGEYPKVTADLFQLTCGHRAELIKNIRDAILSSVKDPVHREALKKIPTSCANLFADEQFTAVIDKAGGVKSVFRPKYKGRMTPAPQNNPGSSGKQPTSNMNILKPFQRNRNEVRNNNHPRTGPNNQSYRGRGGKYHAGRNAETYKGRRTGSPSSHWERRGQYKRRY
ncbi:RND multidrug efflux transporter [Operophtera brumata]|uniref:RND multidrug efflux transporter n=1 Tax=Operophtera brumata TaxID=104452 RepID=A0A0L7I7Q1_OPEBR|nr:RND multidrug efflux transporter [Operophtera brumata]